MTLYYCKKCGIPITSIDCGLCDQCRAFIFRKAKYGENIEGKNDIEM